MSFEVHVSRRAEQDIEAAYQWLRELDESAAERWIDGLEIALESLSEHPERCGLAIESQAFDQEIRQLLYGKRTRRYRVLFYVERDTVSFSMSATLARRRSCPTELGGARGPSIRLRGSLVPASNL